MRYINKELPVFKEKGEEIVYQFLSEAYVEESHYEGLDYDNFRKPEYRKKIESLLREEQYNICCYCMRNVSNDTIPLKPQAELTHYPHVVAYANLVISCNGISEESSRACCMCNGPRGNEKIMPLMLLPDCLEQVGYIRSGYMYSKNGDKEIADTIKLLNLNYDRLKEIRKIWYLIGKYKCWSKVSRANSELLRGIIFCQLFEVDRPTGVPEEMKKYFYNDFYWNLLLKYQWFYGYYMLYG